MGKREGIVRVARHQTRKLSPMKKEKTEQQLKEKWRKKCVDIAKKIARKRANFICEHCGIGEPVRMTHGSHIYSEGFNTSMSADTDNILCLCWLCHLGGLKTVRTNRFSWHGTPKEASDWFEQKFPKRARMLKIRSRKTVVCTLQMWKNKYEELKKEYE